MAESDVAALDAWIGRSRSVEDEINHPTLRRISALLDRDDAFALGDPIPAHWYAMFFPEIAPQSKLGTDGHPRTGDFLPPVPLPRRMLAGRRVRITGVLHVGDAAVKRSTIAAITPKHGRSGQMVFVTLRHDIEVNGRVVVTEEQDIVYRGPPPKDAPAAAPASVAPAESGWTASFFPTPVLLFRYSAITFNGHRIHYDAPYASSKEGYPALVVNGGLTTLFLIEAAIVKLGREPSGYDVRTLRPLFVDRPVTLRGTAIADGGASAGAMDDTGATAVSLALRFD